MIHDFEKEPRYIKLYYNSADILKPLTNYQISLLLLICKNYYEKDGACYVDITEEFEKEVIDLLSWGESTYIAALRGIKRAKVIKKVKGNTYQLHPELFGTMDED